MRDNEPNEDILRKVQAALNLAAKAGTPAEAAAASTKATELMERYNLTSAMLEKREGKDGKRKQEEVIGGHKAWQRELWANVARLNFCLHWVQEYRAPRERTSVSTHYGHIYRKGDMMTKSRHVVIGRIHNVEATKAMAGYLEKAINRLLRERLTDSADFNWKEYNGSFGASFREGAADDIVGRIGDRRRKVLAAEERKRKAAEANGSTGTDLSLTVYIDEETDANNDFIHGNGWSAEQAKRRMEAAIERKRQQEAYTAWAAANPEEAKREAEEARKRERRRGGWGREPRERQKDWSAYSMGAEAAKNISLDKQVDEPATPKGRISGPKAMHMGGGR